MTPVMYDTLLDMASATFARWWRQTRYAGVVSAKRAEILEFARVLLRNMGVESRVAANTLYVRDLGQGTFEEFQEAVLMRYRGIMMIFV